jgi:uroporphyrinogen-III synthase
LLTLLLRPQAKCQASAQAFNNAGVATVACGLIDTVLDEPAIASLPNKIADLARDQDYKILVTSTVAATQAAQLKSLWPANVQFFAVGKSTAAILEAANIPTIVPHTPRTEGLLALPEFAKVNQQPIIIMKGFGGRELLHDTLVERGAKVTEWEVYKRQRVVTPRSTQDWQAEQIQCIIATSGEVILAAFDYFEPQWLTSLHWIVVSQRTADIAAKLGVTQITQSRDASDQALIQSAKQVL